MARYIELDALVAEINRIDKSIGCDRFLSEYEKGCNQGKEEVCDTLRNFLDTLELKEVDFEAEWRKYFEYRGEVATVNVKHLAKHFFELGMLVSNKTKKEENV